MPERECIWKPPMPISLNMSIWRSSSSFSRRPFHAQNGAQRYSLPGFSKRLFSNFSSMV